MTTLLAGPAAQVMTTAQELLTKRAGAPVTLAEPEDLGGSGPAVVLRVRAVQNPFALPKTMVIKQVTEGSSEDAMLREVVSYQFANSLAAKHRPGPELVAYSLADHLIVLTDLGSAPTMADLLATCERAAIGHALTAWAQALGRMHVATVGREVDFAALLRRLDVKKVDAKTPRLRPGGRDAPRGCAEILATALGAPVSRTLVARVQQTHNLFDKGGVRAFSPSEVTPDNILVTEHGVRILDYEWGGFRDIALDIAHALTVYPDFLNATDRDAAPELDDAMIEAWRSEVAPIAPALADDAVLARRIIDARLTWVWLATREYLDAGPAGGANALGAQLPARAALLSRWNGLRATAERVGDDEIAGHAGAVAAALVCMS